MSSWAEIDENNYVIRVLVGDNSEPDEGYQWLIDNLGGTWIKTSYNTSGGQHRLGGTPLRKNFAGLGYTYDEERDAFIPPKPYASWVLDEETCYWESPVVRPDDGKIYTWNEDEISWDEVE